MPCLSIVTLVPLWLMSAVSAPEPVYVPVSPNSSGVSAIFLNSSAVLGRAKNLTSRFWIAL